MKTAINNFEKNKSMSVGCKLVASWLQVSCKLVASLGGGVNELLS